MRSRVGRSSGAAWLGLALAACGRFGFEPPAPDASIVDGREADSAPNACPQLFCDDFATDLSAWDGMRTSSGSTVAFDPGGARDGAMRAVAPAAASVAALFEDVFTPLPAELYVRALVFAPSGFALDLEPLALTDPADGHQIVVGIYDDGIDIHAHGIAGAFEALAPTSMPRDRWVCFELHVSMGATGGVELAVDGVFLVGRQGLDTRPSNGDLSRLVVGIASKPTTLVGEVLVDDVVADTAKIGCP